MVLEVIIAYTLYSILGILSAWGLVNLITSIYSLKEEEAYTDYFPQVSVVIRSWNDAPVVERCILNLLEQKYPKKNYEIIIVDDGSTDSTQEICSSYSNEKRVRYVKMPEHKELKAEAIDYAIKEYATGDIIVETDVDAVTPKNWIATMVRPFKDPEVGGVTGSVMSGNWQNSILSKMRAIEDFWQFCTASYGRFKLTGVGLLYGGSKAYRKSVWEELGGHSKKTLVEDTELAVNIFERGYKLVVVKSAPVIQEEVEKMDQYFDERLRWISGNMDVFKRYDVLWKKNFFNYAILNCNTFIDVPLFFCLFLSFLNPLFLIPLLLNLLAIVAGLWSFNAKLPMYYYILIYLLLGPILQFSAGLTVVKDRLFKKKIKWKKIWHHNTPLEWPTNKIYK